MNLKERLKTFLEDNYSTKKKSKIGLAVSGGTDSMVMLRLVEQIRAGVEIEFYVLHFNHRLQSRAEEASRTVCKYCEEREIPFIGGALLNSQRLKSTRRGMEAEARRARYRWFEGVYRSMDLDGLLLAHHRDDQVETVLLNIGRGSGLFGLQGMEEVTTTRRGSRLLRPLLSVSRDKLEKKAARERLPVVEDPTNSELNIARNMLRRRVLPAWKEVQPAPEEAIFGLSRRARRENEFWEQYLRDNFSFYLWPDEVQFEISEYGRQKEAARLRLLHYLSRQVASGRGFSEKNYRLLDEFFRRGDSGKKIDLPGELEGVIEYERGVIYRPAEEEFEREVEVEQIPGEISWRGKDKIFLGDRENGPQNSGLIVESYLHYNLIKNAVVRTYRPGDRIEKEGKELKIKELFQSGRVPFRARDFWPLFEREGEIVGVPGLDKTTAGRTADKTRVSYLCFSPCVDQMKEEK